MGGQKFYSFCNQSKLPPYSNANIKPIIKGIIIVIPKNLKYNLGTLDFSIISAIKDTIRIAPQIGIIITEIRVARYSLLNHRSINNIISIMASSMRPKDRLVSNNY